MKVRPVLFLGYDTFSATTSLVDVEEMDYMEGLRTVARLVPDVEFISCSNSREFLTQRDIAGRFPADIARRLVTVLDPPVSYRSRGGRQREIEAWLVHHQWARPVAVDTEQELYDTGCSWLVPVKASRGWDESVTQAVLAQLDPSRFDIV